ncbi:hypothetical protein Tco_1476250 [Tanacetum coccineum]
MNDAEVEGSDKDDEEITDATKEEVKKTSEDANDSVDANVSSLLDIPIQHETSQIQSPSVQKIPVSVIPETTNLPPIPEISYVPTVVDSYLDTKVEDVFQKELQKHTADLIHKYSLHHLPQLTKKPTPTVEQESEKSPLQIL